MIISKIPIYFRSTIVLFVQRLFFSYVSAYFALGFDFISEPLPMSIRVSTPIEDSLDISVCGLLRHIFSGSKILNNLSSIFWKIEG